MLRNAVVLGLLAGCPGPAPAPPVSPAVASPAPAATTTCYAGVTVGMGQRTRTLVRRSVDPAGAQIVEDVGHDQGEGRGATSLHVVMAVTGDHYTIAEASGAFTGTGTLTGEPWRWTSWRSTTKLASAGIEVESRDELTATNLVTHREIRKDGKVVGTTSEKLAPFDCDAWDRATAELAAPVLDDAACTRGCRNYVRLKFWQASEPKIAALPAAERDAARAEANAALARRLEAGLASCVAQCLDAHNAPQTACLADAKTADQLAACDAR